MRAKTKILIVEHDPNDIELIQRELKKGGINYASEIVRDEPAYSHALKNFIPDIILSDYSLPNFDGPTAFKMREKMAPDTPFIFVSGTIGEENSIELIKNGVTDYALKDKLYTLSVKVKRALKAAEDAQQKTKTEQEILREKNLSEDTINSLPGLFFLFDQHGRFLRWNKNFETVSGYSAAEISSMHPLDFFDDAEKKLVENAIQKAFETGFAGVDARFNTNNNEGILHYFTGNASQFNNKTCLIGMGINITERKKAEETLKRTLHKIADYKHALDESSIVSLTDSEGIIKYANDNFCRVSQYSREELTGQNHRIVNSGYHSKEFFKEMWQTISKGEVWRSEMRNKAKDGTFYWVLATIVPFLDEAGKPYQYIAIRKDISVRKKAEETILELNITLEERVRDRTFELLEANTALEAFSYSASHDLRAPVRNIGGFVKMINKNYAQTFDPDLKEMFEHIESGNRRMDAIIEDLLTLARYGKEKLHAAKVDMNKLFANVSDDLEFSLSHKAKIEIAPLPTVLADGSMLEQVIVNLLGNAIKYSSKKEKPLIQIGYSADAAFFTFYIKDNGAGFDMKFYERLFGAFQRLHGISDFEGTGVGLTLVKRIIEKHGGKVWAKGKVGEGATFYFTLPIANATEVTVAEPREN